MPANSLMQWRPRYGGLSGFRAGIAETVRWFSGPANLSRYKHEQYNV